jgi:hypothetical protein
VEAHPRVPFALASPSAPLIHSGDCHLLAPATRRGSLFKGGLASRYVRGLAFDLGSGFHRGHAPPAPRRIYSSAASPHPRASEARPRADAWPAPRGLPMVLALLCADRLRSFRACCFRAVHYSMGRGDDERSSAAHRTMHALRRQGGASEHAERRAGNGALSVSGAENAGLAEGTAAPQTGYVERNHHCDREPCATVAPEGHRGECPGRCR